MAFGVRVNSDLVSVDPGATVPFGLEIENTGEADRFEIQIEGLDPEWTAVPEPVVQIAAGASHSEKIFLKPPRVPESKAGNYPFVVKVRSLETGEFRSIQAVLEINSFHGVSMDISPRRGFTSPIRSNNVFAITLVNLGNSEHTFELFGNDPEGGLAFEFETNQVTLGPGQQKTTEMAVDATKQNYIAGSRLFGFSVSARSRSNNANTTAQAQLEQRPLLSIATLVFFAFALSLLVGWWMLMPKPARLSLTVEKTVVTRGEPIRINWLAEHASAIQLDFNGQTVTLPKLQGSQEIPTDSLGGTIIIEAAALKDGKKADVKSVTVEVKVPEPAPDPVIERFSIDKRSVPLGSSFIVTYKLNKAVVKAYLQPEPDPLPLELNERQVTPTAVGKLEYTLVAQNADGKTVRSRTITVDVFEKSEAVILSFNATPTVIEGESGSVVLRWTTSNARQMTIKTSTGEERTLTSSELDQGEALFTITATTQFTLTATDNDGLSTSKNVRVELKKPTPPPVDEPPTPEGDGVSVPPPATTTGGEGGNPPPR